jgi:lipopolysaccharide/colanic/teichoic acid biosynthesis glycosyltransferase
MTHVEVLSAAQLQAARKRLFAILIVFSFHPKKNREKRGFTRRSAATEERCANRREFFPNLLIETPYSNRIYGMGNSRVRDGAVPFWKRALDISCVVLALPGVLFFMLLIAALIKLVSRGPILIRQERIGFQCRRFGCLKFRTMHIDADTGVHRDHLKHLLHSDTPMVKMDSIGDPRVIRFGTILRATGLDELPQLINVLRGEMSLVGPRPCLLYEFERYEPWQRERFATLPGLTGLWQVRGKNHTTFAEMIRLDIQYARTKSLSFDLQILAATFGTLASQVKAVRQRPCQDRLPFKRPPRQKSGQGAAHIASAVARKPETATT